MKANSSRTRAQLIMKFDVIIDSHCSIDGRKRRASNLIRRDDPIRILFGSHEISERFVTQVSDQPDGL